MVAASPDKWIWDINKQNCFKAKDIEKFTIMIKNNEYHVRADLKDGILFILEFFKEHVDAIKFIDRFIEVNL